MSIITHHTSINSTFHKLQPLLRGLHALTHIPSKPGNEITTSQPQHDNISLKKKRFGEEHY